MFKALGYATLAAGLVTATACAREAAGTETASEAAQVERVAPDSATQVQLSFAPIVREAAPAVVNVYSRRVISQRSPFAGDPFFERFFGPQVREREENSLGSGVIVDAPASAGA